MGILLINPSLLHGDGYDIREIPLGIAYIEDAVKSAGIDCFVFDFQLYSNLEDAISSLNKLIAECTPELIGFSINSYQVDLSMAIKRKIELPKTTKLFAGGVHASLAPDDLISKGFDYVIIGEGEHATVDLYNHIKNNIYIDKIICSERIIELDKYAPDYSHYIQTGLYNPITIILSRGCKGHCGFCSSHAFWNNKITAHSVNWLNTQLSIIGNLGVKKVLFVDDSLFSIYDDSLLNTLYHIHKQYGMSFGANSRICDFPLSKVDNIIHSGITAVSFGIEAMHHDYQYSFKTVSSKRTISVLDACKRAGIKTRTSWIFGLPEFSNDIDSYRKTIEMMIELSPDEISIHWLIPYVGSKYQTDNSALFDYDDQWYTTNSYNKIPIGLYKYLNKHEMLLISQIAKEQLEKAGYKMQPGAEKYFFLPQDQLSVKRSFF